MIVDCHCHTGKGDMMTAPWNTNAPIEPYLRRARAAGIDKTIVFSVFHSDYAKSNPQVAQTVARYPDRLLGFVMVHAKRDKGRIFSMVRHAVTRWGFRGMKVHGLEAPPTREICDAAIVRHPNVYADTSSVRHYDYIVEAIKRGGPKKVLFGSDGPWLHPGVEIHKIRLLGLPANAESQVLGGNILRLIQRPD
jgi:uncharacterized protein